MIKWKKFLILSKCLGLILLNIRYDFMVDEYYNTWILEINKSPSMDTKTVKCIILGDYKINGIRCIRRYS